jgi:hypothetical protein
MIVALDASPLSLLTHRKGVHEAEACRAWAVSLVSAGATIVIRAIADYEVRREMIRAGKTSSIKRLDELRSRAGVRYLPMTDQALGRAASLWAQVRNAGLPTASPAELDCDVVLVAILQTSDLPQDHIIIATSNVGHLTRFAKAERWHAIAP